MRSSDEIEDWDGTDEKTQKVRARVRVSLMVSV
jgi:hypothetical protein